MLEDLGRVPDGALIGHDRFGRVLPVLRLGGRVELLEELRLELGLPLFHERRGSEDQDAVRHAAHAQLLHDDPGFDGLAETDLVGEDRPSAHGPAQYAQGDVDLVR